MIPDEAVEAAALALWPNHVLEDYLLVRVRKALEAAAPYSHEGTE